MSARHVTKRLEGRSKEKFTSAAVKKLATEIAVGMEMNFGFPWSVYKITKNKTAGEEYIGAKLYPKKHGEPYAADMHIVKDTVMGGYQGTLVVERNLRIDRKNVSPWMSSFAAVAEWLKHNI